MKRLLVVILTIFLIVLGFSQFGKLEKKNNMKNYEQYSREAAAAVVGIGDIMTAVENAGEEAEETGDFESLEVKLHEALALNKQARESMKKIELPVFKEDEKNQMINDLYHLQSNWLNRLANYHTLFLDYVQDPDEEKIQFYKSEWGRVNEEWKEALVLHRKTLETLE